MRRKRGRTRRRASDASASHGRRARPDAREASHALGGVCGDIPGRQSKTRRTPRTGGGNHSTTAGRALIFQKRQIVYKPLGEICTELGFVSGFTLRDFLAKHQKQILLGDLLVNMGIVNESQVAAALETQRKSGKRLGQILIDKGFATRPALADALSMQLGIPKIAPTVGLVDETLLEGMNSSFFYTKGVVPLSRDDERGVLTVLMDDPLDFGIITDLEKIYKTKIEPAVSTTGETTRLLDCLYDPETRHGPEASLTLPSKEETVIGVSALKLAGGEADPSLPKLRRQTRETRPKPPETDAPGPLPSGKVRLTGGDGAQVRAPGGDELTCDGRRARFAASQAQAAGTP